MPDFYILLIGFFFIALIYASVGFGGGSSYLALLAVMGVGYETLRPTALLCNIVVVTGGTFIFYREGKLDFKKAVPFVVASVPFAFLGGYWKIGESVFFLLLGLSLVLASVFLWIQPKEAEPSSVNRPWANAGLGGALGLLSGMVGIGGGIFLAPLLHLLRWDVAAKISALAGFFILVNSVGGLAGQWARLGTLDFEFILPLLGAVLAGGQVGSRLGARKFTGLYIKRITAVLILLAGINILRDHL
ncbi:MAG: sulfite exporter TauE/SafE family protein [Bacteroidota bacterium]